MCLCDRGQVLLTFQTSVDSDVKWGRFFPVLIFNPVLLALILQIIKPRLKWQRQLAVYPLHGVGKQLSPRDSTSQYVSHR